jgi:hypothetical protein
VWLDSRQASADAADAAKAASIAAARVLKGIGLLRVVKPASAKGVIEMCG